VFNEVDTFVKQQCWLTPRDLSAMSSHSWELASIETNVCGNADFAKSVNRGNFQVFVLNPLFVDGCGCRPYSFQQPIDLASKLLSYFTVLKGIFRTRNVDIRVNAKERSMLATKIRCIVIRVSEDEGSQEGATRQRHDALPWADPYVLGLIAKLQHEVREERAAKAMARREAAADSADDFGDLPVEALTGDMPPPFLTVVGAPLNDDEDEFAKLYAQREGRRPR
jgi:hypothetical protein